MTLSTEDVNPFSIDIGEWDIETISSFIHLSDIAAYEAVGKAMSKISEACKMILESLEKGGRVIYLGAGTSGRVAAQDAVIPTIISFELIFLFFNSSADPCHTVLLNDIKTSKLCIN